MEGKTFTSLVAHMRATVSDITDIVRGRTLVSGLTLYLPSTGPFVYRIDWNERWQFRMLC